MSKKNLILIFVVAIIIGAIAALQIHKNAGRVEVAAGSADIPLSIGTSTLATGQSCNDSYCTTTIATSSVAASSSAIGQSVESANITSAQQQGFMSPTEKLSLYPRVKELVSPDGFINTVPFKIADLIGKKVILLDFWTYSCINCQRTIPYLNSWYQKYKDDGLVIIGVHSPEFDFEKNKTNVENAVKQLGIQYPVVQDNEYGTWNAYQNLYWPHEYLIDIDGFIVHDQIGEGGYQDTEKEIQHLLDEKNTREGNTQKVTNSLTTGLQGPGLFISPETYFGSNRNEFLANGTPGVATTTSFTVDASNSTTIGMSKLYLNGTWDIEGEYAQNIGAASIVYKYQANKVHFVAGTANNKPMKVDIYNDGAYVKSVTIQSSTLYTLIDSSDGKPHVLQIKIPASGLQAYTFTFS